ncbi:unnamed protein product [Cuscuta europaea]|uniref:Uncharacterized protein n=1 Tax=Cuscuta europaea TaxID=41803 RepID=A0A9P0Z1J9_CUSEU|nr:unnamed protein product [Cuscuta europaea]
MESDAGVPKTVIDSARVSKVVCVMDSDKVPQVDVFAVPNSHKHTVCFDMLYGRPLLAQANSDYASAIPASDAANTLGASLIDDIVPNNNKAVSVSDALVTANNQAVSFVDVIVPKNAAIAAPLKDHSEYENVVASHASATPLKDHSDSENVVASHATATPLKDHSDSENAVASHATEATMEAQTIYSIDVPIPECEAAVPSIPYDVVSVTAKVNAAEAPTCAKDQASGPIMLSSHPIEAPNAANHTVQHPLTTDSGSFDAEYHTDAPMDATICAEVFVQHLVALDETPVATLNVAVTEGIHQLSRPGNDEIISNPQHEIAVTKLVPNMSSDEIISEDTQMRTFSISGHADNLTIEEEKLEGFTQVQRRRSRNSISKIPPNEDTEEVQLYYEVGYRSHPMITRRHSKRPQNETTYFLYRVDERFDSPQKLAAALQRFKLSRLEETTYMPCLKNAIRFHNKYNRSIAASLGIPSKNFNC